MSPTTLLAFAATCALSTASLAAPHHHTVPIESSRAALNDSQSFAQVHLGDLVQISIALQDGTPLDLELERFTPFTHNARIVSVDQSGIERPIDLSDDVHLRGHVAGDQSQIVYIGITGVGTNGFIEHNHETHVISTGKFAQANKASHNTTNKLTVFPSSLLQIQPVGQNCAVDINNPIFTPLGRKINNQYTSIDSPQPPQSPQGVAPDRNARVAVETDYEFTAWLFGGNTAASASYASSLLAAVSTIYDRDVNMTLSVPFLRTYESNNDPYGGSDIIDFLEDVQSEFNTGDEANIQRAVVHGLSARGLGGGVAYLPGACDDFWGIGVSANLEGFFPSPLQDNSWDNWDLIVSAHELGHNFGTGHTHDDFTPAIDGCGDGDCSDALDATIMSYCHLCTGGLSNIDLRFHQRVQDRILAYIENDAPCDLIVSEDCPMDLAQDGSLNFLDISAFLDAFSNTDPVADWNNDSSFNFLDVSAYLASFAKGCP